MGLDRTIGMPRDPRARAWTEGAVFALASVLLAQTGLGILLFLIPIQIASTRRGTQALAVCAPLAALSIAGVTTITTAVRGGLPAAWGAIVVEVAAVFLLLLGLVATNLFDGRPLVRTPLGTVPRLLMATGAAGPAMLTGTTLIL